MGRVESYIVRLWTPEGSSDRGEATGVRGIVRHVRSGRETRFASWGELRALLGGMAEDRVVEAAGDAALGSADG